MESEPLYCAEQINIPEELGEVIRDFTKEVIRAQPEDVIVFGAEYFKAKFEGKRM
jgi:hypothetical protein